MFYDKNTALMDRYIAGNLPEEEGLRELWERLSRTVHFAGCLDLALMGSEFIFVAVQTPHAPEQDGSVRFNHVRANFDLTYVKQAISEVSDWLVANPSGMRRKVVVISTMLPGSMDAEIAPLFKATEDVLLYSPSFIAMGTVVHDFTHPEFWLIGHDDRGQGVVELHDFYATISDTFFRVHSYATAELSKVLYNTWITMKITLANLASELAYSIPNCDGHRAMWTLQSAHKRIVAPAYMSPGMVDGGGCHPRDNIAMSWLSDKLGLKYNLFDFMVDTREKQVEFLADVIQEKAAGRYVLLSSRAFKHGTNIEAGSPAVLLSNILTERGVRHEFGSPRHVGEPICFVVTTPDPQWDDIVWGEDDVVVNPWRGL
jgi:UDPglucose 6-dehydrogenase